jgi:hypothetical protein
MLIEQGEAASSSLGSSSVSMSTTDEKLDTKKDCQFKASNLDEYQACEH